MTTVMSFEIGDGTGPWCDNCGLDMSFSPDQVKHLESYGTPVLRPPCPHSSSGLHLCTDVRASIRDGRPVLS